MIPVCEPLITEADSALVVRALAEGQVSSAGRYVAGFERRWAEYCGRRHGIAVANGTVALQLAVACLDLEPGDEVILPTFTIVSCALAVLYSGGVPRLVDVDPVTWTMDIGAVRRAVGPRTRAIMPVHIYGHPVDMDPVLRLADTHGLAVIEDAAEAHGAEYHTAHAGAARWQRCGSFGTVSCFSFYANKLVTTGEGGMLVTDDDALAERARLLRNLAFAPGVRRFRHERMGFNFRMTSLQAALGIAQIERMAELVEVKRRMARRYAAGLGDLAALQLPAERPWARSMFWMFGIVVNQEAGLDATILGKRLLDRGVDTRPFFLGLHEQPVFATRSWSVGQACPEADRLARQGLYLPGGLGLSNEEIDHVIDSVRAALA